MMLKLTFGLFLSLSACIIGSAQAADCIFDDPGTQDGDPCAGQALVIPLFNGGLACCSTYGSMSLYTTTINGVTTMQCTCPDSTPSISGGGSSGGESAPATSEGDIGTFRQEALSRHNSLRALHGSPPLTLKQDLNDIAQAWAEHLAQTKTFAHSSTSLGENLATIYGYVGVDYSDGGAPVQRWYDEIKDYDYSNPFKPGPDTGHFTQVVWKSTTELGIGKARSADGTQVYVVGTYRKAGNVQTLRQYADNVPPLL